MEKMVSEQLSAILLPAALGGIGGLTRGFVGLLKAISLRRRILWGYYAITVLVALVIGIFVGVIFNFDPKLSLLAGYAGTDILEGIYKSFAVQKVYVSTANASKK
jgi:fluoride ion exporter CrcB/FEX